MNSTDRSAASREGKFNPKPSNRKTLMHALRSDKRGSLCGLPAHSRAAMTSNSAIVECEKCLANS